MDAVTYAKKNLSKFSDDEENWERLKNAMGMLSFRKERLHQINKYSRILSDENWRNLVEIFVQESYKLHSLTMKPLLLDCLSVGVSILQTLFCFDDQLFNESCPTCWKSFRGFKDKLPLVVRNNTILICKISGVIMDEHNPPMMLPNNFIYSEKALRKQANENNGKVKCPKTKNEYKFERCRKVYIS